SITIYPNPSTGSFTITGLPVDEQIQIINSMGQTVKKASIRTQATMNFTLDERGVYLVRTITDKEIVTKKIIVCK
ncbi:MAG: T9SS type A sorting domain-containing protein, partial [Bacteroidota bacterium]